MQGILVDYSSFHSSWSGDSWNEQLPKADEMLCSNGVQWYCFMSKQGCYPTELSGHRSMWQPHPYFRPSIFLLFHQRDLIFARCLVPSSTAMAGDVLPQSRTMNWSKRVSAFKDLFVLSQLLNSGKIKVQTKRKETKYFYIFLKSVYLWLMLLYVTLLLKIINHIHNSLHYHLPLEF